MEPALWAGPAAALAGGPRDLGGLTVVPGRDPAWGSGLQKIGWYVQGAWTLRWGGQLGSSSDLSPSLWAWEGPPTAVPRAAPTGPAGACPLPGSPRWGGEQSGPSAFLRSHPPLGRGSIPPETETLPDPMPGAGNIQAKAEARTASLEPVRGPDWRPVHSQLGGGSLGLGLGKPFLTRGQSPAPVSISVTHGHRVVSESRWLRPRTEWARLEHMGQLAVSPSEGGQGLLHRDPPPQAQPWFSSPVSSPTHWAPGRKRRGGRLAHFL